MLEGERAKHEARQHPQRALALHTAASVATATATIAAPDGRLENEGGPRWAGFAPAHREALGEKASAL